MADQAKGKEEEEDGEDYSKVIEVLKQHIKSYKRVIASQSSNIKTLLLSLNTLKASVKDSSPRFDPFSGTIYLDSPLYPPRKEPHLGLAVDNTATSNLDPLIDRGSKEGFKDTITSSIVKELSKKAYTIPHNSKLSGESNFKQWIQALTAKAIAAKGRIKRNGNTGIYTNNTGPFANKDKDNAYNRAYKPPANTEEEGGSEDNSKKEEKKDNGNDNNTGDSTSNSKDEAS
ncbi:hypothetical protein P8C59_004268 [Phyllachora maydis]|uniref:Uncharacterized protein n=1 Tax=Phyllachora maydis TaxID=1825666 RepID=A0AAD9I318_9PEZI|nr:hypothetical protein P8C59_004268 [Phyllachora maydis]